MSAVTITLTNVCSGGGHLTVTATGDITGTQMINRPELSGAINKDDPFAVVICKLAKMGRTVPQAIALLQAGVTVTI